MSMQTQTNLALVTSVGVVQQVEGITTDLKQNNAIIQYNKHITARFSISRNFAQMPVLASSRDETFWRSDFCRKFECQLDIV